MNSTQAGMALEGFKNVFLQEPIDLASKFKKGGTLSVTTSVGKNYRTTNLSVLDLKEKKDTFMPPLRKISAVWVEIRNAPRTYAEVSANAPNVNLYYGTQATVNLQSLDKKKGLSLIPCVINQRGIQRFSVGKQEENWSFRKLRIENTLELEKIEESSSSQGTFRSMLFSQPIKLAETQKKSLSSFDGKEINSVGIARNEFSLILDSLVQQLRVNANSVETNNGEVKLTLIDEASISKEAGSEVPLKLRDLLEKASVLHSLKLKIYKGQNVTFVEYKVKADVLQGGTETFQSVKGTQSYKFEEMSVSSAQTTREEEIRKIAEEQLRELNEYEAEYEAAAKAISKTDTALVDEESQTSSSSSSSFAKKEQEPGFLGRLGRRTVWALTLGYGGNNAKPVEKPLDETILAKPVEELAKPIEKGVSDSEPVIEGREAGQKETKVEVLKVEESSSEPIVLEDDAFDLENDKTAELEALPQVEPKEAEAPKEPTRGYFRWWS